MVPINRKIIVFTVLTERNCNLTNKEKKNMALKH